MLSMSQGKLGAMLKLTFQQVQKYEKGTNRIGASRLQAIANILQVPVSFFFEGAPHVAGQTAGLGDAPSPVYVTSFMATSDGLSIAKSATRITDPNVVRQFALALEAVAQKYPDPNVVPFVPRKQQKAEGRERAKRRTTG